MPEPHPAAELGDLERERRTVLDGCGVPGLKTATAPDYLAGLPRSRFASLAFAAERSRPLIQPRGGFPSFTKQRALTEALAAAGADFLPLTIDSHTRHNHYDQAAALLALSEERDRDLLNGYPLVCHGHELSRELYAGIDRPVSLRHGTPDARLLVEVALATGITEIEGGGLTYSLPYAKTFPIDRSVAYWQYVDRLCATVSGAAAPIHRESFGPLTATMVPPFMMIVVELCELLLAAEQGVRSFGVGFSQTGSLEQDVATANVLRRKAAEYLERFAFRDVSVVLVYHQWMGAFPTDPVSAWQIITLSAGIARLLAADKVVVKTTQEALGVPTIEKNAEAVRGVRYALEALPELAPLTSSRVAEEEALIASEVDVVMERLLDLPDRQLWQAVVRAVDEGIIDVPFAPHQQNANRLVTVRDGRRAIRVHEPGSVPMTPADLAAERRLLPAVTAEERPLWERLLLDVDPFS